MRKNKPDLGQIAREVERLLASGKVAEASLLCRPNASFFLCSAQARSSPKQVQFLLAYASVEMSLDDYPRAQEILDQACTCAKRLSDPVLLAECHLRKGSVECRTGNWTLARDHFLSALATFRWEPEQASNLARCYNNLGILYRQARKWSEAVDCLEEALRLHRELKDGVREAITLLNLGVCHYRSGKVDTALPLLEDALAISRRLSLAPTECRATIAIAWVYCIRAQLTEAEKLARQALSISRRLVLKWEIALALELLGDVALGKGSTDEAAKFYNAGLMIARKIVPEGDLAAELERKWAEVTFLMGKTADAEASARRALDIAERVNDPVEVAASHRALALVAGQNGNSKDATAHLGKALEILRGLPEKFELARTLCVAGQLAAQFRAVRIAFGDEEVHLIEARALCSQLGLAPRIRDIDERLAHLEEVRGSFFRRRAPAVAPEMGKPRPAARIHGFITTDERIVRDVEICRKGDMNVLITGETGTGKELLARALHALSRPSSSPFVVVDCGTLPEHLIESELFGHAEGAFTGATSSKVGLLETANGGTVFIDEVGDLPLNLQTRLLRFLQEKEFRRLGETKTRRVDVRVIAATNSGLEEAVHKGEFREDLYFRLCGMVVRVPPLRERKNDIEVLLEEFVDRFSKKYGKQVTLEPAALQLLVGYEWPGNVRELQFEVERIISACEDGHTISESALSDRIRSHVSAREALSCRTLKDGIDAFARAELHKALERNGWRKKPAAQELGLSEFGLAKMMRRLGVESSATSPGSR
jgi:DNA-binding NtrC family response regulator/tetratricopeptide (TPR) repeat protein